MPWLWARATQGTNEEWSQKEVSVKICIDSMQLAVELQRPFVSRSTQCATPARGKLKLARTFGQNQVLALVSSCSSPAYSSPAYFLGRYLYIYIYIIYIWKESRIPCLCIYIYIYNQYLSTSLSLYIYLSPQLLQISSGGTLRNVRTPEAPTSLRLAWGLSVGSILHLVCQETPRLATLQTGGLCSLSQKGRIWPSTRLSVSKAVSKFYIESALSFASLVGYMYIWLYMYMYLCFFQYMFEHPSQVWG